MTVFCIIVGAAAVTAACRYFYIRGYTKGVTAAYYYLICKQQRKDKADDDQA